MNQLAEAKATPKPQQRFRTSVARRLEYRPLHANRHAGGGA